MGDAGRRSGRMISAPTRENTTLHFCRRGGYYPPERADCRFSLLTYLKKAGRPGVRPLQKDEAINRECWRRRPRRPETGDRKGRPYKKKQRHSMNVGEGLAPPVRHFEPVLKLVRNL